MLLSVTVLIGHYDYRSPDILHSSAVFHKNITVLAWESAEELVELEVESLLLIMNMVLPVNRLLWSEAVVIEL